MDKWFDILGIPPSSSQEEIKKAYRNKARLHHPDKGGDPEVFKKINEAYSNLTSSNTSVSNIFFKLSPTITQVEVHLEHLCKRFVVKFPFERNRVCSCTSSNIQTCKDCKGKGGFTINLGFLSVQQPCQTCFGNGKIYSSCANCKNGLFKEQKIFDIYLSPELENGHRYHFTNEGHQDINKNISDLIVVLSYKEHSDFKVENKNLIYKNKITLKEALCGYTKQVTHPSGELINIVSDRVLSHKQKIVIEGKGITNSGNLIIEHSITFPETLSEEVKNTLQKLNF